MEDRAVVRLADALELEFRQRAERYGWSPVPNKELVHSEEGGLSSLLAALPASTPAPRPESRLPEFRRAFDLLPTAMSLLICGLDHARADESYRAALWWTGLVRSELSPSRRSDLHLLLIAPIGTESDPSWRGRRSQIESDDRFCRKFVWLPSSQPDEAEVRGFFDRTFLAQPWESASAEPRSLDPLKRLVEEAGSEHLLSSDEAGQWIARLGALEEGGAQQIAEDLVGILDGTPQ